MCLCSPSQAASFSSSEMVALVPTFTSPLQALPLQGRGKDVMPLPAVAGARCCPHHICSCPLDVNLVTGSRLAARAAGKCSPIDSSPQMGSRPPPSLYLFHGPGPVVQTSSPASSPATASSFVSSHPQPGCLFLWILDDMI